jgi:hypothetical protein
MNAWARTVDLQAMGLGRVVKASTRDGCVYCQVYSGVEMISESALTTGGDMDGWMNFKGQFVLRGRVDDVGIPYPLSASVYTLDA